jgi:hypothetical protein
MTNQNLNEGIPISSIEMKEKFPKVPLIVIQKYAQEHNLPTIGKGKKNWRFFFPIDQNEFAIYLKHRPGRGSQNKKSRAILVLQFRENTPPKITFFKKTYNAIVETINATKYSRYLECIVGGRMFMGFVQTLSAEEKKRLTAFLKKNPGMEIILIIRKKIKDVPKYYYYDISAFNIIDIEKLRYYFSIGYDRATLAEQKYKETDKSFAKRVYKENQTEYKISFSAIEQILYENKT